MSQYPTNLTDKQWQVIEIILDPQHRKRKYSLRDRTPSSTTSTNGNWRACLKHIFRYSILFNRLNIFEQYLFIGINICDGETKIGFAPNKVKICGLYPMPGRVLIISYYWPPTGGSGVQRWVKFSKYLPAEGELNHRFTGVRVELIVHGKPPKTF